MTQTIARSLQGAGLRASAFFLFVFLCSVSGQALAETEDTLHAGHAHHASHAEAGEPKTDYFEKVMAQMHKDMHLPPTGNVDVDFMRGMIPHHQGAIDMARIVLEHGKDPEVKKLAEEIIEAQAREIAFMEAWLKKNGY